MGQGLQGLTVGSHRKLIGKRDKSLKVHKLSGPDQIRPHVLKEMANVIAPMLTVIQEMIRLWCSSRRLGTCKY